MEALPAANPPEFIQWCLDEPRRTELFTRGLGLPQTEQSKGTPGRTQFEGDAADHCKALDKALLDAQRKMAATHFSCKKDLRDKAVLEYRNLADQFISPLIDQFGPVLWNASNDSHSSQISRSDSPRSLVYTKNTDRAMLTLYLYGWNIARLARKPPTDPNSKRRKQRKEKESFSARVNQSHSDDEDVDITVARSQAAAPSTGISRLGNSVTNGFTESIMTLSPPVSTSLVPVAQMLPMRSGVVGNACSTINNYMEEAVQEGHTDDICAQGHDAASESDEYQPPVSTLRSIKRRGVSLPDAPAEQNKRQRNSRHCTYSDALDAASHGEPSLRRGYNGPSEENEAAAYPSPPGIEQTISPGTPQVRNFPNIPPLDTAWQRQASERVTETSHVINTIPESATQDPSGSTTNVNDNPANHTSPTTIEIAGLDDDVESVFGDLEVSCTIGTSSKTTPNCTARPSLVVRMKLATQIQDLGNLRTGLASNLADIRRTGLRDPNVLVLKTQIELLETLSKANHLRLREIYNDAFKHHQEVLKQWLQLLKSIVFFYEVTGFKGGLSERGAFLDAMPTGCLGAVEDAFIHSCADFKAWLYSRSIDEAQFARDVASLFFHLGSWITRTQARIESMMAQLTRDLLAWYE
ncbi:hypothetical protein DE146DRAFT_736618 [Phaeosphaeria sp. MPI-PUGE-AT-0046c]|nr:hypothetical protein DE146DRAFT_736618 [Phaeosphaeria sp. MPI-PUGE-AT-0046c]